MTFRGGQKEPRSSDGVKSPHCHHGEERSPDGKLPVAEPPPHPTADSDSNLALGLELCHRTFCRAKDLLSYCDADPLSAKDEAILHPADSSHTRPKGPMSSPLSAWFLANVCSSSLSADSPVLKWCETLSFTCVSKDTKC